MLVNARVGKKCVLIGSVQIIHINEALDDDVGARRALSEKIRTRAAPIDTAIRSIQGFTLWFVQCVRAHMFCTRLTAINGIETTVIVQRELENDYAASCSDESEETCTARFTCGGGANGVETKSDTTVSTIVRKVFMIINTYDSYNNIMLRLRLPK